MTELDKLQEDAVSRLRNPDQLSGLVWGYRFSEDGTADALDGPEALAALERRENWVWLHLDLVDGRTAGLVHKIPGLPAEVQELLLSSDARQHIETFDQHIAGVVADFERVEPLDPRRIGVWRFCMAPHAFISTRHTPLHTMAQLHREVSGGRRLAGVLHLFDAIVHGFTAALAAVSHQLAETLDTVEDSLLDARETGDFEALGTVRRSAVRLHRQTQPLRAMLHHLNTERPAWFTEDAADDCATVGRRVDGVAADLVALQERARILQDEFDARQTQVTNRRLMLLSVITAALLPPTLITGIFGMNVDGLPFKDDSPYGFIITMGMLAASMAGTLLVLRRLKMF